LQQERETTMKPKECPCPQCNKPGDRIEALSKLFKDIDYFECRGCSHVWTSPKGDCHPAELVEL
jgi:hypothetical protein